MICKNIVYPEANIPPSNVQGSNLTSNRKKRFNPTARMPSRSPSIPFLHRNHLMKELEDRGIATRPGTHTAVFQDYYRDQYDHSPEDFPNAYRAQQLSLALPLYVGLSREDQEHVVDKIKEMIEEESDY